MDLFHAVNRGVEKRQIFLDNQDRARFVHDLFEFNSVAPANNTSRHMNDLVGRSCGGRLVDIHGWCIMGNHYHLILSEVADKGLTKFLMKLNVGYAKYFNARYERTGVLFQGRTKKVHIESDAQFLYILHYVHMNPLDFLAGERGWREDGVSDHARASHYLRNYRWSSYLDYCGEKNFPSILRKDMFTAVFPDYQKELSSFMHNTETPVDSERLE